MTRIGSLFSGAGGLDLAVEAVFGAETVWHCENDKAASKVLTHHWPDVPNHGDITAIDWTQVEPVDILCGGWPCQPFSLAGKRQGATDERALWPYVAGAVRMVRPRIVVLENVSAVLGPEFSRVANDLATLGYGFAWTVLRASHVGAPHRRERIFIVAYADQGQWRRRTNEYQQPTGCAAGTLPADSACDGRHQRPPQPARQQRRPDAPLGGTQPVDLLPKPRNRDGKGATASRTGDNKHDLPSALLPTPTAQAAKHAGDSRFGGGHGDISNLWQIHHLLPTPTSRDHKGQNQRGDDTCLPGALLPTPNAADGERGQDYARAERDGSGGDDLITCLIKATNEGTIDPPACLPRAQGKAADTGKPPSAGQARADIWGRYAGAIHRWEHHTRPAPPPTEPNSKGNPRLDPAFSEWMMGWPAGWVTNPAIGIKRNDQLKIIGNGVCPQQAVAALRYLLTVCGVAA